MLQSRSGIYHPAADATTVTLLLAPGGRWVAEYYPVEEQVTVEFDGRSVGEAVTMRVSRIDWLIRLIARLGGHATLLAPTELRHELLSRTRAAREQHTNP